MDSQAEIEDIFEDGLLSIFGDAKVSHGGAGQVFSYPSQANRYLPCPIFFALLIQVHSAIKVHMVNTSSFEERGTLSPFPVINSNH